MTKEELRDDPVMDWIQNAIDFVEHNSRWLGVGALAVVVIIVGIVMVGRSQQKAALEAEELLVQGQSQFLQSNYSGAEVQLRELVTTHGGSNAARVGRIYLGDALLAQGRIQEALGVYDDAAGVVGGGDLEAAAQRGRGAALESLGRLGEASQAYEAAAAMGTSLQLDDFLGAARCALRGGEPQRAKALLETAQDLDETQGQAKIELYLAEAEAALHH